MFIDSNMSNLLWNILNVSLPETGQHEHLDFFFNSKICLAWVIIFCNFLLFCKNASELLLRNPVWSLCCWKNSGLVGAMIISLDCLVKNDQWSCFRLSTSSFLHMTLVCNRNSLNTVNAFAEINNFWLRFFRICID